MIELAQHIEVLLLENDCVIVPGLGGFVAHYTPAMRVAEENVFLPPTRIIGFNPQLKMNDGLLVQSYMAVYDTDFSDATRIVEKEVAHIFTALHEEGKVDLPNIGELRYSIHGIYDFVPYDHKITTPYLYGLDSFEMQELAELKKPYMEKTIRYSVPVVPEDKKRRFEIKFNRSYLSNAVAMIAVVALFFFLSTPIENTEVVEGNYAQLLPNELFEMIEKESLAINPIVVSRKADTPKASAQKNTGQKAKKKVVPVAVREVKVGQANAQNAPVVSQPKQQAAEVSSSTSVTTKSEIQKTQLALVKEHIVEFNRQRARLDRTVRLGVAFVVMKSNAHELALLPYFSTYYKVNEVNISNVIPTDEHTASEVLYNNVVDWGLGDPAPMESSPRIHLPLMDWQDPAAARAMSCT